MNKIVLGIYISLSSLFGLELNSVPAQVVLNGTQGSKVDGTSWNSSMLQGKVHIVFYVDPDKKDLNTALSNSVKEKNFNRNKFASVAIINLAATWLPNIVLESLLEEKQKEFPHTLYVKDKKKVLVEKWKLADDNSDILLFDKQGRLIYQKFGQLNTTEINALIKLIEANM